MYRIRNRSIEVFLAHPGGPFWETKDKGAWTIPKGQFFEDEEPIAAAKREFQEETGFVPTGEFRFTRHDSPVDGSWWRRGPLRGTAIPTNSAVLPAKSSGRRAPNT